MRAAAALSLSTTVACAAGELEGDVLPEELGDTAHCELDTAWGEGEPGDIESSAYALVSQSEAQAVARSLPRTRAGLPLWESRPGARVALFLDFDGGLYDGDEEYGPASLDRDLETFNAEEQVAIIRAAMEVAESYSGFDVNVTTDDAARRRASRWAWILITNDVGTSGKAKIDAIGRSSYPLAIAGAQAVFSPPSSQRGYLLTHELGHNFGLEHSGLWQGGRFREWSELRTSRTSDWMGGRNTYFTGYQWVRSQTEESESWQDPARIIGAVAGVVGGDGGSCHGSTLGSSDYCSASCRCNDGEGDCDTDADCASGLVCDQRSGTDYCIRPSSGGGTSCTTPIRNRDNGGRNYGVCEGDCDSDADCQPGLRCVQLNSGNRVPGCSGRSVDDYDYCVPVSCL